MQLSETEGLKMRIIKNMTGIIEKILKQFLSAGLLVISPFFGITVSFETKCTVT